MQEIRELKTRDADILSATIREMSSTPKHKDVWDLETLSDLIKRIPCDTYIIYSTEIKKWVFTNILDEDLVFQEYFNDINFVIVENDLSLAMARGIHYRFHKKMRP